MENYTYKLILSYFYQVKKNYSFDELKKLIGKDSEYLDEMLVDMKNKQYICYENYEIIVSKKGRAFLIANDCLNYKIEDAEYYGKNINPDLAMPITEIYIPKDFLDKI